MTKSLSYLHAILVTKDSLAYKLLKIVLLNFYSLRTYEGDFCSTDAGVSDLTIRVDGPYSVACVFCHIGRVKLHKFHFRMKNGQKLKSL